MRRPIPKGFSEQMASGMLAYVVPHSLYPGGYHCAPETPLPFINVASQKNYVALYHFALSADARLLAWFERRWRESTDLKLDRGKACVRFKKPEHIPHALIGELAARLTPEQWIEIYEQSLSKRS